VISTKAGAAPSTAYSEAAFDALWRAALTCSGHAQQWLFQDDFAELMSLAHATTWQARDLASRAAEALAAQVDLPERTVALVENPLAFERSVLVPLLVTFVEADQGGVPAALRLEDGRGLEVEYQIQNEMRHEGVLWELAVLARLALPAGGWNTVSWKVDDTAAEEVNASTARSGTSTKRGARQLPEARPARLVLENELLRIDLDQGRLVRVEDKETGLVDVAHAGLAYGHLCAYSVDATAPLHAGSIAGQQDAEWLDWRMLETGPVRQAALVLGRVGAHAVRVEIRLPTRERRIEFAMSVDWRGQDGFLAFHLPLPAAGELWGGIPYGAERKELANEPYVGFERSRPGMFWAQDFVDWTDGSRGVACLPHDGDVYYVSDDARNALGHILINSFTRPADTWEKDVNREIEARGTHTFVTSLVWHPGDWRTAQLWSLSRSLTVSPVVVRRRHGQGSLPPYHSLLSIEPANVCLAALYQEGDATLARLYETAGQATTATLTFPAPVREATVVDLLNEPLSGAERDVGQAAPIAGTGGTDRRRLTCQLRPWQIRTIALRT
jgi:Glycosyl hydrolases family 38 C-terminal beta sandwich domain/Glycosyl hydrolases family 38 C-terminal domain